MTSKEIRQSFLDFFTEKEHTIVPSASLLPTSPNLLFTNAGMNQFVPFFLGAEKPPYDPPRAADTQKCIRAGGKHNDLEDVGYDTYHHTFFEMLGNWSFGNYFKKEAINWAWELLVDRWGFPPERLYATVYKPGEGDPSEFDQEAYDLWEELFKGVGLDPAVHIVNGGKKDNFWMMGDTGPCGPCSELHMDLTPHGDTGGKLVNADSESCIEIWNLVFIQYNAEEDGSFRPLPACHVDTGMGFERVCSIIQGTDGLKDFSQLASNYKTDVFRPLFDRLEEISGKTYTNMMPRGEFRAGASEQEKVDIAFRVIADHIRTLSFSIADGILPGNKDRNYVLRRILRRAVRYGRSLGLGGSQGNFMSLLVDTLAAEFGDVFPELLTNKAKIESTLDEEESSFNQKLERGTILFEKTLEELTGSNDKVFPPKQAFKLYDTFGFPVDLTNLMVEEYGLTLDLDAVEEEMEKQRQRGRDSQKKTVIAAADVKSDVETHFVGYDKDESVAQVWEVIEQDGAKFLIVDPSPFYAEMGGQVGDTGLVLSKGETIEVLGTSSLGGATCLQVDEVPTAFKEGEPLEVILRLDSGRRRTIEAHHSATHLLHWALHEVVSKDIGQQGSFVGADHLRFDINSQALSARQIHDVERLVNERIVENATVSWIEVPHSEVKGREDIMQFFGDKYGAKVRVVQIGGSARKLNGYSMELCGGTHVGSTGEIGLFKIRSEGAIAAGTRRVEAVCGIDAVDYVNRLLEQGRETISELESKLLEANKTLDKERAASRAREADGKLADLVAAAKTGGSGVPFVVTEVTGEDPALLQEFLNGLKKKGFEGVGVFAMSAGGKVHLGVSVSDAHTGTFKAGELIGKLAPIVGGKGGGKPGMARGAGSDPSKIGDCLAEAQKLLG